MKKKIALAAILVMLAMTSAGVTTAWARPCGPGGGGGHGAHLLNVLLGLSLSDAQKHEIAVIMKTNRDEFKAVMGQVRDARKDVFDRINAEPLNEDAVRQAVRQLATVGEQAAVLRARVFSEIKGVLTPEQRKALADKRARFEAGFEHGKHRGSSLLDDWIDTHSK